jgi:hypothetical protein
MLYQRLTTQNIELGAHEAVDWDAADGVVFVPQNNSKVFLHWLSDRGNLRSTYTMTDPTRVSGHLRLTNALDTAAEILVVHLD